MICQYIVHPSLHRGPILQPTTGGYHNVLVLLLGISHIEHFNTQGCRLIKYTIQHYEPRLCYCINWDEFLSCLKMGQTIPRLSFEIKKEEEGEVRDCTQAGFWYLACQVRVKLEKFMSHRLWKRFTWDFLMDLSRKVYQSLGWKKFNLGTRKKKSPLTVTLVSQQEGGWLRNHQVQNAVMFICHVLSLQLRVKSPNWLGKLLSGSPVNQMAERRAKP